MAGGELPSLLTWIDGPSIEVGRGDAPLERAVAWPLPAKCGIPRFIDMFARQRCR